MIEQLKDNRIHLKRIFIEPQLPNELQALKAIANNIWWSWQEEGIQLFKAIDAELFEAVRFNPVQLLDEVSADRLNALAADKAFLARLKAVEKSQAAYLKAKPDTASPRIAYFCMEYGLHISLRLYSGGLGVLAGDYLKEASDMNVNLNAVGLLYRYGYFQQSVSLNGDQINNYPPQQFTKMPLLPARDANGEWVKVSVGLQGRSVYAKVWELKVGRISLYLLDTDIDENAWEDRKLTHQLYGGDNEHRLKQEILLGIGGMRALKALGLSHDIYHCNEGHAAFLNLERLCDLIKEGHSYEAALELVRASSLFTTHTPVPAGHDYFSEDLLRNYLYRYAYDLGITWEAFVALGRINANDPNELFSMSHLAIRLSQAVNGVSQLHGTVSQKMFNVLYPGFSSQELHIGYVTNSVHYPTWIAPEWHQLYLETFGSKFVSDQPNKAHWRKIQQVPSETIMGIRQALKSKLVDFVKTSLKKDLSQRGENPRAVFDVVNKINDKALIIGFARRFATYKRAHLLFTNLERLASIVNHPERPVVFLFSGKAHPADGGGQMLIRRIVEVSRMPQFVGKVIFLENYNMESAKLLVQGVDIWLNTPTRPKEASGTSGMKAAMNGVMNYSVLDGWWAEGYQPGAGWALPLENTFDDERLQNELDAETIYNTLEHEIAPLFYERDERGISEGWVQYIRNIIAEVAPDFTMTRMVNHYFERFYTPLHERSKALAKDKQKGLKSLVEWKANMRRHWNHIEVLGMDVWDTDNHPLPLGQPFNAKIQILLHGLEAKDLKLEVVFYKRLSDNDLVPKRIFELAVSSFSANVATFECNVDPAISGVYEYGFRLSPQHPLLPHAQDINLVTWF